MRLTPGTVGMSRKLAFAALLALTVSALSAQTTAKSRKRAAVPAANSDEMTPLPILKLTVEGNHQFPSAAILAETGLKVGDIATNKLFESARQRLADLGIFDSVGYESHAIRTTKLGYAARFEVKEVSPLYKIQFAGFPEKTAAIEAYLKSRDPLYTGVAPPTQQIIDRWAKFLDAYSASQNHPKKIIGKVIPGATANDAIIQFQPDEPLPVVARVEFTGNDAIDSTTLQNSIGAVAYGLPYSDQNFRDFLEHQVKPLYEARGMLKVRFEDITSQPVPLPTKGLLVNVKVIEGPVYKLRKIFVSGVDPDEKDRLIRLAALKGGEVVNFDAINAAALKVNHSEQRRGYLKCTTAVDRKLDDPAKLIDVTFKVEHGPQYTFGILTIKGLDLNGEAAVRKQWGEKPGDPFNPDYPDYFLSEIKNQGIFDHLGPTHSTAKTDDESHLADVTLLFSPQEKKPEDEKHRRDRSIP